ncbi:MAG: hypothetical protein R3F14_27445 [Polyangiaceae bacterium]
MASRPRSASSASRAAAERASSSSTRATGTACRGRRDEVGSTDSVLLILPIAGRCCEPWCRRIQRTGRNAQGVRLMDVEEGERIVAIETFTAESDPPDTSSSPPPGRRRARPPTARTPRRRPVGVPTGSGDPRPKPDFPASFNDARSTHGCSALMKRSAKSTRK